MTIFAPRDVIPMRARAFADIRSDVAFALQLLTILEKQTFPWEHAWNKEQITPRDLADVCQVAEAIEILPIEPLVNRIAMPAMEWLTTLAAPARLHPAKNQALRLYPNRLKTLAIMGAFPNNPGIRSDFSALSLKFDNTEGKIKWDPNPTDLQMDLVTLIWMDTLLQLEELGTDTMEWQDNLRRALDSLEISFEHYAARENPKGYFALDNLRDISYAFDILVRANRLDSASPLYTRVIGHLTKSLRQRRPNHALEPGELYAALQLASHTPHDPAASDAVRGILQHARTSGITTSRNSVGYEALLVRLLATFHGETLHRTLQESLWEGMADASDREALNQAQQHEDNLSRLLQHHFYVQLGRRDMLSQGMEARVYRQHFRFQFGVQFTGDAHNHDMPMNVIIKESRLPALLHAADAYDGLPAALKPFFAAHGQPESFSGNPRGTWYLMMHDLDGYSTLRQVLNSYETSGHKLFLRQRIEMENLAQKIAYVLNALHRESKAHHPDIHALDNLYLMPLNRQLGELGQQVFRGLRQLMYGEFNANGELYHRFGKYRAGLHRYEEKLRPPQLGLIHGDCHSRNIMVNPHTDIKLVDLENLENNQDYLLDYALLLEDVALYPFIQREEIALQFPEPGEASDGKGKAVPQIRYPLFTPSPVAFLFQEQLLHEIETFAQSINDQHWRPRLWLATARALTLLSARRFLLPSGKNNNIQENIISMLYAESIRLLHELLTHLETGRELPPVPFPGTAFSG